MTTLIVDDHPMIADGIAVHAERAQLAPVIAVLDAAKAISMASSLEPHLAVVDIMIGSRPDGLDLARLLIDRGWRVVIYSGFDLPAYVNAAIEMGASGYVSKSLPVSRLVTALVAADQGQFTFSGTSVRMAREALRAPAPREAEIIRLVAEGQTNAAIAGRLGVSTKTIESSLRRLFSRYGTANRTELASIAIRQGWYSPGPTAP